MLSGRVRARDDDNKGDLPPPKRHKQARRSVFSKIHYEPYKDLAKNYYNSLFRSPFWIKMEAQVRPYHRFLATENREACYREP